MTSARLALGLAATIVGTVALTGCGNAPTAIAKTTVAPKPSAPTCSSYKTLASKPGHCLTAGQKRARAKAAARATKELLAKEAAAERAAVKTQAAAARQAAAATAAANAWHAGYLGPVGPGSDVYFRWRTDLRCADYATDGCVHIETITALGCQYLAITMNETQGGAIVGSLLGNQVNVPARTPSIIELDADRPGVGTSAPSIDCEGQTTPGE